MHGSGKAREKWARGEVGGKARWKGHGQRPQPRGERGKRGRQSVLAVQREHEVADIKCNG